MTNSFIVEWAVFKQASPPSSPMHLVPGLQHPGYSSPEPVSVVTNSVLVLWCGQMYCGELGIHNTLCVHVRACLRSELVHVVQGREWIYCTLIMGTLLQYTKTSTGTLTYSYFKQPSSSGVAGLLLLAMGGISFCSKVNSLCLRKWKDQGSSPSSSAWHVWFRLSSHTIDRSCVVDFIRSKKRSLSGTGFYHYPTVPTHLLLRSRAGSEPRTPETE